MSFGCPPTRLGFPNRQSAIDGFRITSLVGTGASTPPSYSGLRPRPETIEPGGKERRLRVAEGKRGGAQRVGLQRHPCPQVGRGLNDHQLAEWTSRSESELAIGGVEEIGNGERVAQN